MRVHRDVRILALCWISQIASGATTEAGPEEPKFQADVYNELYEAHEKCDENLSQTRSEFIVEMFERYRGTSVSKELLRKLLLHNIRNARMELSEARKERKRFVTDRMNELESSPMQGADSNNRFRVRQKQLELLDDRISTKQRYVEVSSCVLAAL